MVHKALLLAGLKKQYELLGELLEEMESKTAADAADHQFFYGRTKAVAVNLRRLRKKQRAYRQHFKTSHKKKWKDFTQGLPDA